LRHLPEPIADDRRYAEVAEKVIRKLPGGMMPPVGGRRPDGGTDGAYTIPSMPAGTYSVTVSLIGFKTSLELRRRPGCPCRPCVNLTLQVGAIEETVTVIGESPIVQTQTPPIPH
jgi:hypothetical protein